MLWVSMSTSPMTLTLDFQGQILKMLYLRNGRSNWHWTKGMWVNRMLHSCCDFQHSPHPWPRPWIFKVKFWKCCISGMAGQIDMEQKGCESIGCNTHFVTLNFDLNHDFDLGFSRKVKFWKSRISRMGWRIDMEWKGVSRLNLGPMLWLSTFPSPMTLTLDFQGWILKKSYLMNRMADWHGTKGMWVDRMLDPCCDFQCSPLPWPWP